MADQVLSVLVFVSNRLSSFLREEGRLLGGLRQDAQLISDEFGHMKAFLQKVAESREEYDHQITEWIRQVRESAYDTEDVLDEFMLLFSRQRSFGLHDSVGWNFNTIKNLPALHLVAAKLQSLKGRIRNISEARLRYESHYANIFAQVPRRLDANQAWRRSKDDDALLAEEAQLEGIDKHKKRLLSQVLKADSQIKVIAVLGMGGLGKTTLVKRVHDDATVKSNFQIRAWVTVSQTCDFEKLLKDLIRQLQAVFKEPHLPLMDSMDIYELKALAKAFLQRARYAIVFDDVWDSEFWNAFKFVLPENGYLGNCVMITTRIVDVASASCIESQGYVYKMEHLTFQESWTLFCRKTFKDNDCPAHLKNVVEGIVGRCEGLPLAIVAISGLLATKDLDKMDDWMQVRRRLKDESEGSGKLDRAKEILRLSYDDLPSTLKTCLLYTSIYPEDYQIRAGFHLIRLWISERFVEGRAGLTAEEVAMGYIKELANRSLVQVSEVSYDGSPFVIHIHDLLREVLVDESRDQNMMAIVSSTQQTMWPSERVVRRLVFHNSPFGNNTPESHHHFNNLRSVITMGCKEPLSKALLTDLLCSKLLKVLNLDGLPLEEIPKEIFSLFHLKYLSLANTRVKVVPKSIERLQNLECLDLKGTTVRELPKEIRKLKKLRHLFVLIHVDSFDTDLGCHGFKAPCRMGELTELQTLERIDASDNDKTRILKEVGKLTQLRTLAITSLKREDGKELCFSLEKLTNLRDLHLTSSIGKDEVILDLNHSLSNSSLHSICGLSLRGRLEKMPPWIRNLQRLGQIKLTRSSLIDDPLESLQHLPNLIEVSLIDQVYQEESLCFKAGGFPKLKKLYLKNMKGLVRVRMDEGAMPRIKRLILRELPLLEELPSGVENLSKLEELELWALSSQLMMKLESEVFEQCEDYKKISHIPQVLIGFLRDGRWSSRLLFQKKNTQLWRNVDATLISGSESNTLSISTPHYFSLRSLLTVTLYLLCLICFFISLFIFTLERYP